MRYRFLSIGRKSVLLLVLVLAFTGTALWYGLRLPPGTLLRASQRVGKVDVFMYREMYWISGSKCVYVPYRYGDSNWYIAEIDAQSGTSTRLDAVTNRLQKEFGGRSPDGLTVSSQGNRLLMQRYLHTKGNARAAAFNVSMTLDDKSELTWPMSEGYSSLKGNLWLPDGSRWIELETPDNATTPDAEIAVHDVDHPTKSRQKVSDWPFREYEIDRIDANLKMVLSYTGSVNGGWSPEMHHTVVDIAPDGEIKKVGDVMMRPSMVDASYERGVVSLDCRKIAWPTRYTRTSTVNRFLHRLISAVPIHTEFVSSIWISDLDGSRLHEVGYTPIVETEDNPVDEPTNIAWLPDGKRISYVFRGSLYVVGVE